MTKNHMKRSTVPKTWKVERKLTKYITKSNPGAHSLELSIPLNVLFKDVLGYCKTTKEVKSILQDKEVLVDGKRRYDHRLAIGLMDVLSIPSTKTYFRISIDSKGYLVPIKINDKESDKKLVKINNQTIIGKGKVQLNLNDGGNIIVKDGKYKAGDSLLIELPKKKISQHIKLNKGVMAFLIGGKHSGLAGEIENIEGNKISIKSGKETIQSLKKFIFVVGEKKAFININEENE